MMRRTIPPELRASRRRDTEERRARVLRTIDERAPGQRLTRAAIAARAEVHPNFISRHPELAQALRAAVLAEKRGNRGFSVRRDVKSRDDLLAELEAASMRAEALEEQVRALERRLTDGGLAPTQHVIDTYPTVISGRQRVADLELEVTELKRKLRRTEQDNGALREANRSLARDVMVARSAHDGPR